jgi:hypothetical protein
MLKQLIKTSVVVVTVLAAAAPAMATPVVTTVGPSPTVNPAPAGAPTQGIIMRDGGVCDPIRHMGC